LRSFTAVAETEHVGRAAEKLRVSQSPLSRQIQKLEAELGLRLFDRVRRRVRLTPAGRWLLRESRILLGRPTPSSAPPSASPAARWGASP